MSFNVSHSWVSKNLPLCFFLALWTSLHSVLNHGVLGICGFLEEEGIDFLALCRITLVKASAGSWLPKIFSSSMVFWTVAE